MLSSNFTALLDINITKFVDKEYIPYVEDLIRIIILQVVIQFMYFVKDPSNNDFFSINLLELIIYISIGVSVYWLIFKKLVKLT
jgi:hypothetical protein